MVDTATTASKKALNEHDHVLQRIEQYAADNPSEKQYRITSELEADQILLAMAAVLKTTAKGINDKDDRQVLIEHARVFKKTVEKGRALIYFRDLCEDDQLEVYGLTLVVSKHAIN